MASDRDARDVSERTLAEENGAFLAFLLECVNDAVIVTDEQLRVRIWTGAAEDIYGWTADETIGRDAREFLGVVWPGDERPSAVEDLERVGRWQGDLVHARKDGTPVDVESMTTVRRTARGDIGCVTVNRDISDRNRIETSRAQSEDRYRSLVEASSQLVWVTDAEGRTLETSSLWLELTGQTDVEVQGWGWLAAVHPEDRDRASQVWARAVEAGSAYLSEYRLRMTDGTYRSFEVRGVPIRDEHGTIGEWIGMTTDNTERKRAEAARMEAEALYRQLAELGPAMVYRQDLQEAPAYITYISPMVEEILGYPADAWTEDPRFWREIVHPDDLELLEAADRKAMATASGLDIEFRFVASDGHVVWVRDQATVVHDALGEPIARQGVMTDITDRKIAEEARLRAETRYRSLFENAAEGVFRSSLSGRILEVNPAAARMLGYSSPEELLAASSAESVFFVDPARQEELRRGLQVHGVVSGLVMQMRRRDGVPVWGSVAARLRQDTATEEPEVEGIATDITQLVRAEEDLRESRERLRVIVDTEPECVKVISPDGTLQEMNPAGLAMIEADDPGQVIGKSLLGLISPEHREAFSSLTERVARGESGSLEFEIVGMKGTHRWLETRAVPMLVGRDEPLILGVARDITERRQAQEELERTADQRRALLDALVTAQEDERTRIARELHDGLGQVLTSLALFASDLERGKMSDTQRAKIAGFRERVQSAVGDMRRLVRTLRPVELDKEGLVAALKRLVAEVRDHPGIEVDIADDLGGMRVPSPADVTVYRVVQEAITNALRHARATSLSVTLTRRDDRLVVVVEDNGRGFDPSISHDWFGILGMRERALLAGGEVTVESAPGRGTTVRLEVPIAP